MSESAQEFATSVYLATQGAHTIGEVAYAGFTAEQGGKRICWEALDPAERKRWQSSGAAVMLRACEALEGGHDV